jgi:hypothetical protein
MKEYSECKGVRKLEILYLVVDSHYYTFGMYQWSQKLSTNHVVLGTSGMMIHVNYNIDYKRVANPSELRAPPTFCTS